MRPATANVVVTLAAATALLSGCPSAYKDAYDTQMRRLETQERLNQDQEEAAHAAAQKYAAIVYFTVGSAEIGADGQQELTWFVQKMQPYPQAIIEVQGFADATGGATENELLSNQRATNVAKFLSSQGIDSSRITTQGFGEQYPAAPNESAKGRRNNRRVEVTVR